MTASQKLRINQTLPRIIKRSFDIILSSSVLIILAVPVYLPIAIAVKLTSKGPVFFRQKRSGRNGKTFEILKFRSMLVNDISDSSLTEPNDKRLTRVGKFLRKTSLDEMPQFFNVLKGEMSVVGPRPHMLSQDTRYKEIISEYHLRHLVKPGITGWAQANGFRGPTTHISQMEERIAYDLEYIKNYKFLWDIQIIGKTFYNIIFTKEKNAF